MAQFVGITSWISKNRVVEDAPLDKRRKVGNCRMMASTTATRSRQPLAPVSTQKDIAVAPSETEGSECEIIEFTKEEVDALLNERFKGKKFDSKGKQEWMIVYMKKLKVCIKWYQKGLEDLVKEKKNLCKMLDSSERKCVEAEAAMKVKEEELNATISTLETNVSSLKESLAKEESEKFDALEYHKREKESRIAAEKNQDSLREELGKAEQNASKANEKVKAQEDTSSATEGSECESIEFTKEEVDALLNERFKGKKFDSKGKQEWMTEYQKKLKVCIKWYQKGLEDLVEEKNNLCKMLDSSERKCVEAEAAMKVKEEELNDSRDDAMKQKEAAVKEVDILRGELQQFRESRERQLLQVRAIKCELERYREDTLRTIDDLRMKSTALEETCSSQQEQISVLQHELAAANHKLKMADLLSSEYEEKKRRVFELQAQLLEGERLRKKLHNTILELKGNIRVFCRVRPLLSDDVRGAEPTVCYPTSVESAGRGIDLIQSGQKYPFTFDKVFADDASQEEVFMEISQLVQSALDGYKVCIFAYGQTGSGKTYTMMGRPEAPQQKGLIPRSLEHVFQTSQALAAQGWKYKMQASMLEIYNETIRDLLSVRSSSGDVSRAEVGGAGKQYTIRHDADGNTYVSDLTIVDVCSIKEVLNLLQQAAHSRAPNNKFRVF